MVTTVNNARTDCTKIKRPPLVVEIVGPAGAGKTTLSQSLRRLSKTFTVSVQPCVSFPPSLQSLMDNPFFIRHFILVAPTLLRLFKSKNNDRYLTRREIAWMIILKGWHNVLRNSITNNAKVIIIDQGPIFLLAELWMFGPKSLKNPSFEQWWKNAYNRWTKTLDMIVYLDTSNTKLLERIRTRGKWHVLKEKSKIWSFEFFANYRVAYDMVISILTANQNRIKVLRFDTAKESLAEIMNRLMDEFNLKDI